MYPGQVLQKMQAGEVGENGGNGLDLTNAEKMQVGQRRRADIKSIVHLLRSRAQRCGHM